MTFAAACAIWRICFAVCGRVIRGAFRERYPRGDSPAANCAAFHFVPPGSLTPIPGVFLPASIPRGDFPAADFAVVHFVPLGSLIPESGAFHPALIPRIPRVAPPENRGRSLPSYMAREHPPF